MNTVPVELVWLFVYLFPSVRGEKCGRNTSIRHDYDWYYTELPSQDYGISFESQTGDSVKYDFYEMFIDCPF